MKLIHFLALSEDEQYEILFSEGNIVAVSRDIEPIVKKLYTVSSFFVEVHFHNESNVILYKKIFKEGELLENYLKKIQLK